METVEESVNSDNHKRLSLSTYLIIYFDEYYHEPFMMYVLFTTESTITVSPEVSSDTPVPVRDV